MNAGIYKILNKTNGKFYIGSAVNFKNRWNVHKCDLRKGTHSSKHMQAAWNKYGEESFEFKKLIVCTPKDLIFYEQLCIDGLNPEYNIARVAGSMLGFKHSEETKNKMIGRKISEEQKNKISKSLFGFKHSEESKRKMRISKIGNKNSFGNKSNLGFKHSEESKAKMSIAKIGNTNRKKNKEAFA